MNFEIDGYADPAVPDGITLPDKGLGPATKKPCFEALKI